MNLITLEATEREVGKRGVRATRRAENVPCVLYGHGEDARSFQVSELSFRALVYTNQFHRVKINLDGSSFDCILKEVDFHPVTDRPIHADFQVLKKGEPINISIPVQLTGLPIGVRNGGRLQEFVHDIAIRCLPENLPDQVEIDVTNLRIGQSILVRDLTIEGVEITIPSDQTIVAVLRPRELIEIEEEEEEEGLEGEEGEGEEGEEGAEGEGSEDGASSDEGKE